MQRSPEDSFPDLIFDLSEHGRCPKVLCLTDLRIFPRNLEPDFTHYLCEQRKEMEIYERSRQRNHSHNVSASSSMVWANRSLGNGGMASTRGVPKQESEINCA
jgi:hypothetical protein